MERSRTWLGWLAVALAGLALVAVLGVGLLAARLIAATNAPAVPQAAQAPVAPQAVQPPFGPGGRFAERGNHGPPAFFAERTERGSGPAVMPFELRRFDHHHGGFWHWPGFGVLGFVFGLVRGLVQIVALGLLVWLLLRLFQQGRGGQPPAAPAGPTTPAGHDPRVE